MNTRSIVVGQFLDPRFLLPKEAVLCAKKKQYLWIHYSIIKMCNKKLKRSLYKNF